MNPGPELCRRWPRLLETPIWRAGGYLLLPSFPGPESLAVIRREASGILPASPRQEWPHENDAQWRGGQPYRFLRGAGAGPRLNGIFGQSAVLELLNRILDTPVRSAGGGSLALYDRPGDALGLHRDIDLCDVTLVTCLWNDGVAGDGAGALRAYPEFSDQPLSVLRARRDVEGTSIEIGPGDSAVLLGGIVPHEVTPMTEGQTRAVSLVCYELVEP
jgi:hypothetical protein